MTENELDIIVNCECKGRKCILKLAPFPVWGWRDKNKGLKLKAIKNFKKRGYCNIKRKNADKKI